MLQMRSRQKRNLEAHRRRKHGDDEQIRAEKAATKAEKAAAKAAAKAATKARPFDFSKDVDRGQVRNLFIL